MGVGGQKLAGQGGARDHVLLLFSLVFGRRWKGGGGVRQHSSSRRWRLFLPQTCLSLLYVLIRPWRQLLPAFLPSMCAFPLCLLACLLCCNMLWLGLQHIQQDRTGTPAACEQTLPLSSARAPCLLWLPDLISSLFFLFLSDLVSAAFLASLPPACPRLPLPVCDSNLRHACAYLLPCMPACS